MFRTYLLSALIALGGFSYAQYKGWDPLASDDSVRVERRGGSGYAGYRSSGSRSYSHK